MFESHPDFETPSDPDLFIWRYLSLAKFIDFLSTNSLHFTRVDQFDDPLEGMLAKGSIDDLRNIVTPDVLRGYEGMSTEEVLKQFIGQWENSRKSLFMNCWHLSQYESAAMWRLYSERGVAIKSTVGKMKKAFSGTNEIVHIGRVSYVDHSFDHIPVNNVSHASLSKSRSFSYENEIRAAIFKFPTSVNEAGERFVDYDSVLHPRGIRAEIDVDVLLAGVYVAPRQPVWFRDVVRSLMTKYGFSNVRVEDSAIEQRPDLI